MTDDLLLRAARALREETTGDDAGARFTRSRIMASVHDERVKRRTRWAFVLPIAATFIASGAYGAVTGKTRQAIEVVARALGMQPISAPAPAPAPAQAPRPPRAVVPPPEPTATESLAPPEEPPPPAPEPPAPVAALAPAVEQEEPPVADLGARPAHPTAVAPQRTSLPGAGGAAADPTFDLYRTAHELHFVTRDYARALGAWDAYLKAAPRGALVPEARYNRALCLVRLHRNDEARAALEPFAKGQYGTYRRDDAEKLLSALPAGLAGPSVP